LLSWENPVRVLISLALVVGLAAGASPQDGDQAEPKLDFIQAKQLDEAIRAHKGKVVVLDVWANFCVPCKAEFPNLVRLHGKYAKDGLVCLSCTVDLKEDHARALKFLKKAGAAFPNYHFDFKENTEWQNHFDIYGPPTVLVYGRDGKLARQFVSGPKEQFTYEDVEKLAVQLLAAGK
jgi:thiol-disulfide isomerase/thioredoxin